MPERLPGHIVRHDALMQYDSPLAANARLEIYKPAFPYVSRHEATRNLALIGIHNEITEALDLQGHETVFDVGCGDGSYTVSLPLDYGHQGRVVGINKFDLSFARGQHIAELYGLSNVSFIQDDALEMSTQDDNSADVLAALFLLYHLPDPEKALAEFKRVLKPGGKFVASSRGVNNLSRAWEMLDIITDELGLEPPPNFYRHTGLPDTENLLRESGFEIVHKSPPEEGAMPIPGDKWEDYRLALLVFKNSIRPNPPSGHALEEVIDTRIKDVFFDEVSKKGYFAEQVQQGFFVCRNIK